MDKKSIEVILKKYGESVSKDIERTWDGLQNIDGNAEIDFKIMPNTDENIVLGRFEATGQKAWIAEYGKGSKMDSESKNPYLSRYKNSELWNKLRKGHFVTGRPKGSYQDIDGNTHNPSGRLAGRVLEQFEGHEPSKAYHVLHNSLAEANALKELFKRQLKENIRNQINIEVKRK